MAWDARERDHCDAVLPYHRLQKQMNHVSVPGGVALLVWDEAGNSVTAKYKPCPT